MNFKIKTIFFDVGNTLLREFARGWGRRIYSVDYLGAMGRRWQRC